MPNTNINIRMDADLKAQADQLFADLGLNMTTAVNMFVRQAIRQQGIPFAVSRMPSSETLAAMQDTLDGKHLSGPYHSVSALFSALEEDDE
ncbi:MAG: type II toxin-antitoxin system RelB/DinJ family antitoxin [Clostridiaceae bacterium]|nr:type II toxin-antitoxin system RelB/DinJ family antitoxin [Clostridiaceae bacterium]